MKICLLILGALETFKASQGCCAESMEVDPSMFDSLKKEIKEKTGGIVPGIGCSSMSLFGIPVRVGGIPKDKILLKAKNGWVALKIDTFEPRFRSEVPRVLYRRITLGEE